MLNDTTDALHQRAPARSYNARAVLLEPELSNNARHYDPKAQLLLIKV